MLGDIEVCVWISTQKHSALTRVLKAKGILLENLLQESLESIYQEHVPLEQQMEISKNMSELIRQEQEAAARYAAERHRESVFKVVRAGQVRFWKVGSVVTDLQLARMLRKVLRGSDNDYAQAFNDLLREKTEIDSNEFSRVNELFLRDQKPAANAVTLDFDKLLVTLAEPKTGYYTYSMKDVSTAVYYAELVQNISEQKTAERFAERLSMKERIFSPWGDVSAENQE